MAEHVILFAGPMGAGKTTAIRTLSEIDVISTEAENSDRFTADKPTTTVALDYGEIDLDGVEKVRLYGIPGQRRFDFMWTILRERARGMVLLVNNDAVAPLDELLAFLEEFAELYERGGVVVAVTRTDLAPEPRLADYAAALAAAHPDKIVPVLTADPRREDQMRMVLLSLIANIEARATFAAQPVIA